MYIGYWTLNNYYYDYKIHYKIIDAIANIYRNDYTEVQFGEIRREIEITSGIREGCTGSTILFKIVKMTELDRRGTGLQ